MLSTAPAGGGLAGTTKAGLNTGSGELKVLDSNIASKRLNLSDHFWPKSSSLLSVDCLVV